MSESFRKSTVSILTVDGRRDADAWILPSFPNMAVTRSVWGKTWFITHIPTGRTANRYANGLNATKDKLRALAAAMAGIDLSTDNAEAVAHAFLKRPKAMNILNAK